MIVVSSLTSADLAAAGANSEGFRCFKAFLQDLEAAATMSDFGITNQRFARRNNGVSNLVFCDSPFEEQVVEFLENQGITEIECQYGCGKFRIDIVIKERGKNLLAIECDGAAYHSSLVARTRDRARQRILETRGWRGRIHRVWSTNWWHFEKQEKEAILAAISSARQAQLNARPAHHAPPRATAVPVQEHEVAEVTSEDARDVRGRSGLASLNSESGPLHGIAPASNAGQQVIQPELDLGSSKTIGGVVVTKNSLLIALYRFIPKSDQVAREELIANASREIGIPIEAARSELNRLINDERESGRLEVTPGTWEKVWRA